MSIVGCSLQCNDSAGSPGTQISCGVTNVAVNQEIRISFTSAIDPNTVTNNSFQLTESGTGRTPAGGFSIDPQDARTLLYRPQLTFDSAGNPVFGLTQDKTYLFKVPGSVLDPLGPYIRNTNGTPNSSRLLCTLIASEPVRDSNPGDPRATVLVLRKDNDGDDSDGDFVRTGEDDNGFPIPGQTVGPPKFFNAVGATRVHRDTPVRFVFDDVMNPATLANPVTGTSDFLGAFVDADGDVTDPLDQVPMQGKFTITIDQGALQTTVVFQPSSGLPSAGSDDDNPRKVVISMSPQIADLGTNTLANAGTISFTPEKILFAPQEIEESFTDLTREDSLRTGSTWGPESLSTGPGGGSGRLGDLVVLPGTVVELDTDSEDFAEITNPAIFNPVNIIDRPVDLEITDGVFEFARLRVDAGGVLRFKGSNPARVYVRGVTDIAGLVDVSGSSAILHSSDTLLGGTGGTAGPNGGLGGRGGSRPDGSAFTGTYLGAPIGGVANPTAGPSNVLDPATYTEVNGVPGIGVQFPSTIDPTPTFVGGGQSGLGWPQPTAANPALHMPQNVSDVTGLVYDKNANCAYPVPSSPGGGGAHALDGGTGDMTVVPRTPGIPIPPDTEGGDADDLGIDALVRSLSPELGLLRGGAGGGGAGGHLQQTQNNGFTRVNCGITVPQGSPQQIVAHVAHSSAGGGGGGGGLQIAAGRRVILSGVIDASGGDGGSGTFPPDVDTPNDLAQAGGGGAGGAVLLQSQRVQIQAVPGRLKVAGGDGGEGSGNPDVLGSPSKGGQGSPGFLRLETSLLVDIANEQAKVDPTESELQETYGPLVEIEDIFTTAVWAPTTESPSSFSGAQSCWIRPTGNFFRLVFGDDAGVPCDPGHVGVELGWDMHLRIAGQAQPQSYRGANDLGAVPLEQLFGADFGNSPVIVRFQGARAIGALTDPCAVPETGSSSPISAASLTDWVCHPALLNDFHEDEALSPNMFRFVILWDKSQPDFAGIEALEDIAVTFQPD